MQMTCNQNCRQGRDCNCAGWHVVPLNDADHQSVADATRRANEARPHKELIAELLDSRRPKTEREHAAAAEIERLHGLLEAARSHNQNLKQAWQAKVDALGLAISDAGYTWTPEMRKAYEMLPNA